MAYDPSLAANYDVSLKQLHTLGATIKQKLADAVADLPKELFLDQTKTVFVPSFAFSAATYPGATNPNLENKPVMVLAVKGVDNADPSDTTKQTISYSFLDMSKLVDTYTAKAGDSAKILNIAGYEIEVKIDGDAGNHISVTNNGLMVDVSDKADKDTDAVAGNIAVFDANGNPVDSGRRFATDAEVTEMIEDLWPSA